MGSGSQWEPEAENWVRWARAPGHDAYWYYRDSFFELIAPAPRRRTLEIGCGEGRVARDLAVRGHRVTALDAAPTLLRDAQQIDASIAYVRAQSRALPFPDRCFDLAVAYNSLQSLQEVEDMEATVSEAGRVLDRGGQLCGCVTHPVTDLGNFGGGNSDAQFVLRPDYFEPRRVDDTVHHGGLTMTFRGWTYTLEQYAVALEEAGLHIETMREPWPTVPGGPYERWRSVPLFLFFRAVKW